MKTLHTGLTHLRDPMKKTHILEMDFLKYQDIFLLDPTFVLSGLCLVLCCGPSYVCYDLKVLHHGQDWNMLQIWGRKNTAFEQKYESSHVTMQLYIDPS